MYSLVEDIFGPWYFVNPKTGIDSVFTLDSAASNGIGYQISCLYCYKIEDMPVEYPYRMSMYIDPRTACLSMEDVTIREPYYGPRALFGTFF